MATVKLSLGRANAPTGSNIDSRTGTPADQAQYTVNLAADVPSAVEVGDLMNDGTNDYMIAAIPAARQLTVQDQATSVGLPAQDQTAVFKRAFDADASSDAFGLATTAIATWAKPGDTYTIECHSEGTMPIDSDELTYSDITLGAGGTFKVTVADGEWHRGIPGRGFVFNNTKTDLSPITWFAGVNTPNIVVERMEITSNDLTSASQLGGIHFLSWHASSQTADFNDIIIHDVHNTAAGGISGVSQGSGLGTGSGLITFRNVLVYNMSSGGAALTNGFAIRSVPSLVEMYNCAAVEIPSTGHCYEQGVGSGTVAVNCVGTSSSGATVFNSTWGAGSDYNAGDDTSAPGANSIDNIVLDKIWNDPINVNDHRLKDSSVLIGAGTTVAGLTTDIRGFPVNDPRDIGPYAYGGTGRRSGTISAERDMYLGIF